MTSLEGKSETSGSVRGALTWVKSSLVKISQMAQKGANIIQYIRGEHYRWDEYPIPLRKRIYAWKNGFIARDYVLLRLDENDGDDYLSSLDQANSISPAVNSEYSDILENKVAFHLASTDHVDTIPEFYGVIEDGQYFPRGDDSQGDLRSLVEEKGDLIIKRITGTHGRGVRHISTDGDGYLLNNETISESDLEDTIRELDRHLVVEYVQNHEYARSISPTSVNTIRVLTVKDPADGQFFIASAVHRFGNESTGPTDNWSGGGFASPVDVDTGEFGPLFTYTPETGLRQLESHPDTDTRVQGTTVPEWEDIKSAVLELAKVHREMPYVGWDVVLTDSGPIILEGNCAPHLALQQLGGGLRDDDRVERFLMSQN